MRACPESGILPSRRGADGPKADLHHGGLWPLRVPRRNPRVLVSAVATALHVRELVRRHAALAFVEMRAWPASRSVVVRIQKLKRARA